LKRRAPYQVLRDAKGKVVGYRKQVVHPLTQRRLELRGDDPLEVMARAAEIERLRRDATAGVVKHSEFALRLARAKAPPGALVFSQVWARYLCGLEGAWRKKAEGFGALRILPALGAMTVHELTAETMAGWAEGLRAAGLHPKTVQNYWLSIRSAVRKLIDGEQLARFPWGSFTVRLPQDVRRARKVGETRASANTPAEFARLLAAARKLDQAAELREDEGGIPDLVQRIGLMSLLALRRGEAVALSWEDCHRMPDGSVEVEIRYQAPEGWRTGVSLAELRHAAPRTKAPKAGSVGRIRLGRAGVALLEAQRALLLERGLYRPTGPVFPDARGYYRGRDVVRPEVMRRAARLAGLDSSLPWTQHSTRHTGATLAAGSARNPAEIQAFTRHADATTLSVYMHRASRTTAQGPDVELAPLGLVQARAPLPALAPMLAPTEVDAAALGRMLVEGEAAPALVDDALEMDGAAAEARARQAHERFFARKVRDYGDAWAEWLREGCPVAPSMSGKRRKDSDPPWHFGLPATVRASAEAAGKRAAEQARRAGETPEACAKRLVRARASAANGWYRWRNERIREAVAAGKGAELPEHVRALVALVAAE
jgi:integrase